MFVMEIFITVCMYTSNVNKFNIKAVCIFYSRKNTTVFSSTSSEISEEIFGKLLVQVQEAPIYSPSLCGGLG